MFTIKLQVIRNTAHRPSTQASYTIDCTVTTITATTTTMTTTTATEAATSTAIYLYYRPHIDKRNGLYSLHIY